MPAISDQVVVVTGASAGVGRAIVHRFARAGCRLGLIGRDAEALEHVRAEVEEMGGQAFVAAADVADSQAVFAAADRILGAFGRIDVWVNDAMATVFSPLCEMTPEEFRRVTEVTYLGFVHGTMAALRHMRPTDRGTIIQIGSALAYRGIPLQSAYCGAKYAIRGFSDSLRCELIHERSSVKLVMVQLPAVNTPQFDWARTHMSRTPRPVAPVVQPEVIADAVFSAACKPAREYWIGFSTLKVILGNMVLPGFLDWYLARVAFAGQETSRSVEAGRADNLFEPVHDLHRTRGSFGAESARSALIVRGPVARLAPYVATFVGCVGFGLLLAANGARNAKRESWSGRSLRTLRLR
jgi:NAD(P)-dependent dehydrogenase (short-subunit alcohol dehydrogenase family)